jgi:hypothetical protein
MCIQLKTLVNMLWAKVIPVTVVLDASNTNIPLS